MNKAPRIRALAVVAFAGVSVLLASVAIGCSSATGSDEPSGEASQAETKLNPNGGGGVGTLVITCGYSQTLGGDPFENELVGLGCYGRKTPYTLGTENDAGTATTGMFETTCPTDTTTVTGSALIGGRWENVYGDVYQVISDYAHVAPFYAKELVNEPCDQTVPSGSIVVGWDPNCTGGGCARVVFLQ